YKVGEPCGLLLRPAVLDDDGTSLTIAEFTESLPEGIEGGLARTGRDRLDEPDAGDGCGLGMGDERDQEEAHDQGEQRCKVPHRMTSSVWKRMVERGVGRRRGSPQTKRAPNRTSLSVSMPQEITRALCLVNQNSEALSCLVNTGARVSAALTLLQGAP